MLRQMLKLRDVICVCVSLIAQSCLTLCDHMNCSPPGSLSMGILQARILEWVAMSSSRRSSQPGKVQRYEGSNLGLPHCRWILYCLSHQGSPRMGVGSLSLLQGVFLTRESNRGLLHCRQVLYQLSYQGSPERHYKTCHSHTANKGHIRNSNTI